MTEPAALLRPLLPLEVLLVEDNPADAELCGRELRKGGYEAQLIVVQTAAEFRARLAEQNFQVVLAADTLPAWSGLEALAVLRQMERDVPLILLSGTVRAEQMTEEGEQGVADFVPKTGLCRLALAVRRALERQQLRRTCAQLEGLATFPQLNPNPVVAFASDGRWTYGNEAAQALAKAAGGVELSPALPVDTAALVRLCLASGQKRSGVEASFGGRTFSWTFFPIPEQQVVHGYGTDITERLSLEAQLRHAQKLESVGRLAAGVAHDFNNLLTVIQGYTGMLRADASLSAPAQQGLQQVAQAAERAGQLTSQLLAFSRRQVLTPRVLDLNEVLTSLSRLLHRTLGEDITYQFQYASELPALFADRGLLEQVIMNLAVNARDAMPRGGQLVLSTARVDIDAAHLARVAAEARPGRFVRLSLADTGGGMDSVTQARLFEPFFTTKEFGKGTGLGLATVYGIVKQHQGWIEVQSQLGQGSTFHIYLPPTDRIEAPAPGQPGSQPLPHGSETILLVEDEPPVRQLIKGTLEQFGYRVLEAGQGAEAGALWQQHRAEVSLLLTDMVMPVGMSGQELAGQFSAQQPALKVLYMSGYSPQVAGKHFTVLDGVHFLQKPFDSARLVHAVRQCLDC